MGQQECVENIPCIKVKKNVGISIAPSPPPPLFLLCPSAALLSPYFLVSLPLVRQREPIKASDEGVGRVPFSVLIDSDNEASAPIESGIL